METAMAAATMQFLTRTWKKHTTKTERIARESEPRIGEFVVDYSPLSREEIAASDPDCDALIRRSRVLSVKRGL